MKQENKRGQVTTFIIIGAILIISVALFLFVKNNLLDDVTPGQIIPDEYADIDLYVKDCVNQVTIDGLKIIGRNGGYFIIPDKVAGNPLSYVKIVEGGNMIIPSWYYSGEIRKPTEDEIKKELAIYVEDNIDTCLNNFTSFKNRYDVNKDDKAAYITFTKDKVITKLDYPMNIVKKDSVNKLVIESFTSSVDLSFSKIFKTAEEIFFSSRKSYFIENMTLDLMSINKDIPITGMDVSCGGKRWSKTKIEDNLKKSIQNEIPQLSVLNTQSAYDPTLDEYANAHYRWDVGLDEDYDDLTVLFRHKDHYNLRMEVSPRSGDSLKSNYGKASDKALRFLCLNLYHFNYDISYPVSVSVIDSDAFGGEGYEFNFAMPIEIESNAPREDYIDSFLTYYPNEDADFCEVSRDEGTQVRIKTEDKVTGLPLENVSIYYQCLVKGCDFGSTEYNGGEYSVVTSVPKYCSVFTLDADKENYISVKQNFETSSLYYNQPITLELIPTKKFMSTLKIFNYEEDLGNIDAKGTVLKEGESALLTIRNDEIGFESYTLFEEKDKEYEVEIPLMTTENQVEIMLINDDTEILGGYNRNLTFDRLSLDSYDEILFKAIRDKVSNDEIQRYDFYEDISQKELEIYEATTVSLNPEFKLK